MQNSTSKSFHLGISAATGPTITTAPAVAAAVVAVAVADDNPVAECIGGNGTAAATTDDASATAGCVAALAAGTVADMERGRARSMAPEELGKGWPTVGAAEPGSSGPAQGPGPAEMMVWRHD